MQRRTIFAGMFAGAALLVLAGSIDRRNELPVVEPPAAARADLLDTAVSTAPRANYNYSVIPGGVLNAEELTRAFDRDPVVAEHYRGVDASTMRPVIVKADRLAYVSYRLGDRVYWTSHKVRIRSGETVLANGRAEIRARCGNCISTAPQTPTSADEPSAMQLDSLTDTGDPVQRDALNGTGHPMLLGALGNDTAMTLVGWPPSAFGPRAARASGVATASAMPPQFGGAMFPSVASAFPVGTIVEEVSDEKSESSILQVHTSSDGGGAVAPRPAVVGVDTSLSGRIAPLVARTSLPGSLAAGSAGFTGLDGFLDAPFPALPVDASPVPEPATILLVGGGIAGLLARRWRRIRT